MAPSELVGKAKAGGMEDPLLTVIEIITMETVLELIEGAERYTRLLRQVIAASGSERKYLSAQAGICERHGGPALDGGLETAATPIVLQVQEQRILIALQYPGPAEIEIDIGGRLDRNVLAVDDEIAVIP